jgi:2',3'-cyclic-nucleotide 2'-phosphodiesterase (5'-nucleotidase family)
MTPTSRWNGLALVTVLTGLLGVFVATQDFEKKPAPSGVAHIVILHTNDMHGQARPLGKGDKARGGFAALAGAIARERAAVRKANLPDPLLVDAGDLWVGPAEGTRTEGAFVVSIMNELHYDLSEVGNHEFDHGFGPIERLARLARFPLLGGNVREKATGRLPSCLRATVVKRVDGVSLRFLGLLTSHVRDVTVASATRGLDFEAEEKTVARELDHGGSYGATILVTHCGDDVDRELANRFHGRIAAIVGGHSHRAIDPAWHVPEGAPDAVLVAQTGAKTVNLGRIDLEIDRATGRVVRSEGRLIPVRPADGEDPKVRALVDAECAEVDRTLGVKIGSLTETLDRKGHGSSTLGNFVTDIMREAGGADVAFTNRQGLRADLVAGDLLLRNLQEVDPFGNTLVAMTFSGAELAKIAERVIERTLEGFSLEWSGLVLTWDSTRPAGSRVVSMTIGGAPVDPARDYRIVTNNFLAGGGDKFEFFPKGHAIVDTGFVIRDLVRAAVEKTKGPIAPTREERFLDVAGR